MVHFLDFKVSVRVWRIFKLKKVLVRVWRIFFICSVRVWRLCGDSATNLFCSAFMAQVPQVVDEQLESSSWHLRFRIS